jgi:hypothetical protein
MKPTDEYKICSLEEAEEFAQKRMENPYELADKLMSSLTMEYDCDKYMEQAATMLRHQADYIKHLEQGLESSIAMNKALIERDK